MAVNLASLATEEIQRGEVLTTPGWLRPTRAVDVKLRVIRDAVRPLEHGDELTFHTGSAEAVAKLALLDAERLEPGQSGWAQLKLAEPVAVAKGDQFIVRIPSPSNTVGGGSVVDPHPKRHRRFQEQVAQTLSTLEQGSPEEILLQQLPPAAPSDLQTVVRKSGMPQEQVVAAAGRLIESGELLVLDGAKGGAPVLNSQTLLDLRGRLGEAAGADRGDALRPPPGVPLPKGHAPGGGAEPGWAGRPRLRQGGGSTPRRGGRGAGWAADGAGDPSGALRRRHAAAGGPLPGSPPERGGLPARLHRSCWPPMG